MAGRPEILIPEELVPGIHEARGVVFQDGIVWGGYVQEPDSSLPRLRVGGQTYWVGTVPGWIVTPGDGVNLPVAVSVDDPRVRIYRIRRDWQLLSVDDAEVIRDAAELNMVDSAEVTPEMAQAVLDQYALDWQEWPGDLGAPFYDLNGNGQWDAGMDEPGLAEADQVIWFVINDTDPSRTEALYGSPPIGLEIQITLWAYHNLKGPLGQIVFKRYRMINKTGFRIDSMFVAQWSDVDLGLYRDDLIGCDSLLDLGFIYNGFPSDEEFQAYNMTPPSFGYVILQDPVVFAPGGSAIFNFQRLKDHKNLPMSAFWATVTGFAVDPTLGDYTGTLEMYNLLNGYVPTSDTANPTPWYHRAGPYLDRPTRFPVNGDPVTGYGDVDGQGRNMGPGARRLAVCSGPFSMGPGDTQEVVIAMIGGLSKNYLSSVDILKFNARMARYYHRNFYRIPDPPPPPAVSASALEGEIVLDWGSELDSVAVVEQDVPHLNYYFEGYRIWQLPDDNEQMEQAVLIATIDKLSPPAVIYGYQYDPQSGLMLQVPIIDGSNSGLRRYFRIKKDYFTNQPLKDGKQYTFAVIAYGYTPTPENPTPVFESQPGIVRVVVHEDNPGYSVHIGDTLAVEHVSGRTTGKITPIVIDPGKLVGHKYQVTFNEEQQWIITDITINQIKASGLLGYGGSDDFPIVEGIYIKIDVPIETGFDGCEFSEDRWVGGVNWGGIYDYCMGLEIPALSGIFWGMRVLPELTKDDLVPVMLYFQGDTTSGPADGWASRGAVYRRDLGYVYAGTGYLPIAAYDVYDPHHPRQVNICFFEDNNTAPANMRWDMGWLTTIDSTTGEHDYPDEIGAREYFFIMLSDYNEGADYNDEKFGITEDVMYEFWPRNYGSHAYLEAPFEVHIGYHRKVTEQDTFLFTSPPPPNVPNIYKLYQNYPNPFNATTTIRYWIPRRTKVTLEIYNILGQRVSLLVDKLQPQGEYFVPWQAQDKASGLYIYRLIAGGKVLVRKMVLIK